VPDVTNSVKRDYRSVARAEQARQTRTTIRAAARELFLRDGYGATSLRAIAEHARVAERTVYVVYGTKLALFRDVLDVAIAGDDEPVALRDRRPFHDLLAEPDGHRVVSLLAATTTTILERAGAIMMIAAHSAGADPQLRELDQHSARVMAGNMRDVAGALKRHGALRRGLTPEVAGQTMTVLMSPYVHELCRGFGWSAPKYRRWLEARLADALLE
jgi:AcrR family transcriptional regulator